MPTFFGFDHIDVRVRSLALVEEFYDRLMPELGLSVKTFAHVDSSGQWLDETGERPYNAVEYHEPVASGDTPRFIGFIERPKPSSERNANRHPRRIEGRSLGLGSAPS